MVREKQRYREGMRGREIERERAVEKEREIGGWCKGPSQVYGLWERARPLRCSNNTHLLRFLPSPAPHVLYPGVLMNRRTSR